MCGVTTNDHIYGVTTNVTVLTENKNYHLQLAALLFSNDRGVRAWLHCEVTLTDFRVTSLKPKKK